MSGSCWWTELPYIKCIQPACWHSLLPSLLTWPLPSTYTTVPAGLSPRFLVLLLIDSTPCASRSAALTSSLLTSPATCTVFCLQLPSGKTDSIQQYNTLPLFHATLWHMSPAFHFCCTLLPYNVHTRAYIQRGPMDDCKQDTSLHATHVGWDRLFVASYKHITCLSP